jgi:Dockerin type I domain
MRMFRFALVGVLPAFVLLVAIQFSAGAASTLQSATMQPWFTGDDSVNHPIWLPLGALSNYGTHPTADVARPSELRQLSFADRVAYQRAVEEVYWRHRIWPRECPDPKPSLEAVMSEATIEQKVQDYLRNSELLEEEWQEPITPEQLQAEMDRMAQRTKQPEVLRELFAALGNDPFVIAECLAGPVLAERMITSSRVTQIKINVSRPKAMAAATANYTLPKVLEAGNGCTDDTWTATSTTNAPDARAFQRAVWTGSEMIIWGGGVSSAGFVTGGRYNPSTDSWTSTSTVNAPDIRGEETAVWTGTEMIVWGGICCDCGGPCIFRNTGGRYNPSTDTWVATTTTGAPGGRSGHTAVWTGTEMIVWGGNESLTVVKTGGRYNPNTDSWIATSTTGAPGARVLHTSVWTGSEMIVWGGFDFFNFPVRGGRYNPVTDTWMATSTTKAPKGRYSHAAVWTGSEMIIWGGGPFVPVVFNTGGRYSPFTDSWAATSTVNAPAGRNDSAAVWTGSEMIVWGGLYYDGSTDYFFNTGGRYDPITDSWLATTTTGAPDSRSGHSGIWTGTEMIVWGGYSDDGSSFHFFNTGGRYCAQAGSRELTLLRAASRKKHGNAGSFDIDLPLTGKPGIECRVGNGGTFLQTIAFTFSEAVTSISGITTTTCGSVNSTTISGSTVTVELGHVNCDDSDITVTVPGVIGASGSVDSSATMTLRTGDVNADGVVNRTDLEEIRMNVGRGLVTEDNFRDDITVDGKVNHGDTTLEKSKL